MSRAVLFRRLEKLERSIPAKPATAESAASKLIAILTASGFTRGDNESWAEVWARALGITPTELRGELMRRAHRA